MHYALKVTSNDKQVLHVVGASLNELKDCGEAFMYYNAGSGFIARIYDPFERITYAMNDIGLVWFVINTSLVQDK